jgi:hypothetical protein
LHLKTPAAEAASAAIEATFVANASKAVSKGSKPVSGDAFDAFTGRLVITNATQDRLKLAPLPKNFKGVVLVKDLVAMWQLEAA